MKVEYEMGKIEAMVEVADALGILEDETAPNDIKCSIYGFKITKALANIAHRATNDDLRIMRQLWEALDEMEKQKKRNEA